MTNKLLITNNSCLLIKNFKDTTVCITYVS